QEVDEEEEKQPDPTTATNLPTYMKEYTHLFNKTNFDRLPDHTQWDHEIKLTENAPSELQAKIYPMILKEEEELNAFVDENLKSGEHKSIGNEHGYKYIIQAQDLLTSWVEWYALTSETSRMLGQFIFEEILCCWGGLKEIVTDNRTAFVVTLDWIMVLH
ncbi:hypothetical protein AN958_04107, partial [Leucoagaricus sp. SymC.cos]